MKAPASQHILHCSQSPIFLQDCQDQELTSPGSHHGFICSEEAGAGVCSGEEGGKKNVLASSQTIPHPLSSFDTHPRWPPVTQSLDLDDLTEK